MPLRPSHASWKVAASRDQFRAEQAWRRRRWDSRSVLCCSRSARSASARAWGEAMSPQSASMHWRAMRASHP
jgi:hypothetical protein